VQSLRGVADDREPLGDVAFGARQRELVCAADPDAEQAPEPEPESSLQLGEEGVVRQCEQARRVLWRPGPDDPATTVAERQHGDRPVRGESLVRHVVVEALRRDGRDDCGLGVGPMLGGDPSLLADQ
jgi:hypothetical protein